jgi:predicted SnoaL-like aldol condensation-catalyzing enzyme
MSSPTAAANKRVVERLFDVIHGTVDDLDVLGELVARDCIQHNPAVGQGRAGLESSLRGLVPRPPWLDRRGTVAVNLIAQGDLVVRQEVRDHGMLIDVLRVRDGLCVEHWDAFRPDPGTDRIPGF